MKFSDKSCENFKKLGIKKKKENTAFYRAEYSLLSSKTWQHCSPVASSSDTNNGVDGVSHVCKMWFPLRFIPMPECATLDSHVSDQERIHDFTYWV